MAASYEECVEIQRVSEATGMPCFVAYYRRTLPYFARVKQLIEEGNLGTLSTVQIRFAIPPYATDYDKDNPAMEGEERAFRGRVFLRLGIAPA